MMARLCGIAVVLLVCRMAAAEVEASLPLGAFYRAGHYIPVELRAIDGDLRNVRVDGEGTLPTIVASSRARITAPLLIAGSNVHEILISIPNQADPIRLPLRELRDDEALVGSVGAPPPEVSALLPGRSLVPVQIDPALLRDGRSAAMLEPLDLLVLHDWPGPLAGEDVSRLLGAGVGLLVRSDEQPDRTWPWQPTPAGWLLAVDPLGPDGAIVGEAGYLPTFAWNPGIPGSTRRNVLIVGAIFAILAAGALLLRGWAALGAIAVVSVIAAVGISVWRANQSPLRTIRGEIVIAHEHMTQRDVWTYLTSPRPADESAPFATSARPALVDLRQIAALELRLHWSDDPAQRRFEFTLPANARLALLERLVLPAPQPQFEPGATVSPMVALARRLYLRPGYRIITELAGPDEWPTVVVASQ